MNNKKRIREIQKKRQCVVLNGSSLPSSPASQIKRRFSAASDLGLHCLPMSLLWDSRDQWVNKASVSLVVSVERPPSLLLEEESSLGRLSGSLLKQKKKRHKCAILYFS